MGGKVLVPTSEAIGKLVAARLAADVMNVPTLVMFELSRAYRENGMYAYSQHQQQEFDNERHGLRATKHQSFVGTGYFDAVQNTITGGQAVTAALEGSIEQQQFTATG